MSAPVCQSEIPVFDSPFTHLAAYQFGPLQDLRSLRSDLQLLTTELQLKGTILLSPEGINLFVAGSPDAVLQLRQRIRQLPGFDAFEGKYNPCEHQPYNRMLVRLKKEIIAFGIDSVRPATYTSPKLPAATLKQWLDEGRPVTLLDTRNDYEIKLGTFRNALTLGIDKFRDFPHAVRQLPEDLKKQPIVMFCTGGIRCEKAGPFMEQEGYENIYQLEGGILKYFEQCRDAHYDGECFVFDQRTGVDPSLHESGSSTCFRCQSPLTAEDQEHPHYQPGRSCPHCHLPPEKEQALALKARQQAIDAAASPLPGSQPYDNLRPLTVPLACDGLTLLPFLKHVFPHLEESHWLELWQAGRLVDDAGRVLPLDLPLRSGTRCLQKQPANIEPPVNADIRLLHEDEALIVLHKPAPLPMHPGGRFNRNTLQYILHRAFHPLKPRPAHRLDANTTGVVLFTKTRHFASRLQPQFTNNQVKKTYLARCIGHPPEDHFSCRAPISNAPGKAGSREIDEADGQAAHTDFQVLHRYADGSSLLRVTPITGRTNQIRVHLQHLGFPLLGDPTYLQAGAQGDVQTRHPEDATLCLHAAGIAFQHPVSGRAMSFEAEPPAWARVPL